MNVPNMNKQITFVDSDLQDYQSLIQNADTAEVVILNDNLSAIEQITQALIEDIALVGTALLSLWCKMYLLIHLPL
ncbi:DUF4347 domain-containing protein [Microcoleus sp. BR0-C5]|uniref:DUF4347 domain-containing protein n=1 Tax=Microcoleus sp. BR0-C5 TaxID=2818713 RepID=UPI002FD3193B